MHQQEYGIPASITLAQGLLESGAGMSALATEANNHFGIKCHKNWTGKGFLQDDDELQECFRSYSSADSSFLDHAMFLKKKRYSSLFDLDISNYQGWASGLKQCGYATDPAYPQKLITIIERYELYQYDSGQPLRAKRRNIKADETLEHSLDEAIMEEVTAMHNIRRKWGLHYVVANEGDTFDRLSIEFGISKKKLKSMNDYPREINTLNAGNIIYLQDKEKKAVLGQEIHTVKTGETLHAISQKYGIRLKNLAQMNDLEQDENLQEGQQLRLR